MRSAFTNTFKTFVLLAFLGALFMGIGAIFGIGALLALVFVGGAYWFSDKIAVASARAKPVTRQEAPRLYEIVEDLARRDDIPMPKLYVSPEAQPNAFATGRSPRKAVVCCTQGILQVLDDDELRGVLAHELSHVRNRDILIGSVAAAVALGITFIARIAMFGAIFGGGDDEGGNIFGLLAMAILAPLAAGLLQMPLARALQKIEAAAKRTPMDVNPAEATAYIINPLTGRKVNFANLFSTHPPTEERIARLRNFDRTP